MRIQHWYFKRSLKKEVKLLDFALAAHKKRKSGMTPQEHLMKHREMMREQRKQLEQQHNQNHQPLFNNTYNNIQPPKMNATDVDKYARIIQKRPEVSLQSF